MTDRSNALDFHPFQFNDGTCFPSHSSHTPGHFVFRQETICCSAMRLKSDGSMEASPSVYITFEEKCTISLSNEQFITLNY